MARAPLLHLGSAGSLAPPPQQGRGQSKIAGTSPMSRTAGFLGAATTAGAWEGRPESQILPGWKDHSCGPIAIAAAQLLVAMGASAAGRSHGHHLLLLQVLGAAGSVTIAAGSDLSWETLLVSQFCLLNVFQSTHFCVYRCVDISGILVCWAGEPLWSYERFTSFRLKERQRKHLIPT